MTFCCSVRCMCDCLKHKATFAFSFHNLVRTPLKERRLLFEHHDRDILGGLQPMLLILTNQKIAACAPQIGATQRDVTTTLHQLVKQYVVDLAAVKGNTLQTSRAGRRNEWHHSKREVLHTPAERNALDLRQVDKSVECVVVRESTGRQAAKARKYNRLVGQRPSVVFNTLVSDAAEVVRCDDQRSAIRDCQLVGKDAHRRHDGGWNVNENSLGEKGK